MDGSYADEKAVPRHIDQIHAIEASIDPKVESRLVTKLDICIMPLVTLIFLMNFLDRSAVGNANVAGLSKDLHLSAAKYEYNIGLMLFYIIYIIVEPGSNLMLKKFGGRWLSVLVVAFGIITIATAFMKTFAHFMVLRALLGAAEGGVLPGIAFLLSKFYRRHELVLTLARSGGLLAGALVEGSPIGSVVGWRKIFLVEGIITTGVGFVSWFVIPTSPETAAFLSADEKALAVHRLTSEHIGISRGEKSTGKGVSRGFASLMTWGCAIGYAFINIPVQGTSIFLPTVIRTLGKFTTVQVQLRSVPPYVLATFWSIFISYMCMKTRRHGLYIMFSVSFSVIGYIIFVASTNSAVLYFACFLTYTGAVPNGPIFLAWATANSSPETARAITSAIVPAFGTVGSIAATWAYLPSTAPRFKPGNSLNVGATVGAFCVAGLLILYTKWENKQREAGKRDHRLEGLSESEIEVLGSRHPEFRYLS
ncbi:hypothetical protein RQP46_005173 [Phenoliferia psychrophenolica]